MPATATPTAPPVAAPARRHAEPRPAAPPSVRTSTALWLTAIAAGVFETALMVATSLEDAASGIAIRAPIFVVMTAVIVQMRLGHNWARIALAVLLGVFGSLSLIVEPLGWMLEGNSLTAAISTADAADWAFAGSRALHLAAVLSALALMFTPSANRHFRRHRSSAVPG